MRGRPQPGIIKVERFYFNPRPLAGATVKIYARDWSRRFQSTPPCGGDPKTIAISTEYPRFQSTPPCGGDRNPPDNPHRQPDFNPRPLAGATCHKYQHDNYTIISIHAPLRGRPTAVSSRGLSWSFQSTPPCGGDGMAVYRNGRDKDFNPRPLAGATNLIQEMKPTQQFQSTPPCGGDLSWLM